MTVDQLRAFKNNVPFTPFSIHMTDGSRFDIEDAESLVIHKDWTVNAIVMLPRGRFSFIYLKNIAHVTGEGIWPKFKGRRKRRGNGTGDTDE